MYLIYGIYSVVFHVIFRGLPIRTRYYHLCTPTSRGTVERHQVSLQMLDVAWGVLLFVVRDYLEHLYGWALVLNSAISWWRSKCQ